MTTSSLPAPSQDPPRDPRSEPAGSLPPPGPNPFIGPYPFKRGDRLFGRRRESRELYYLLSAERIVWLHSPSGAGKTSLIWASLAGMFERDGFTVCPPIRVNLDLPEGAGTAGTNPYLTSVLLSLEEGLPEEQRRSPRALTELGLGAYLEQRSAKTRNAGGAGTLLVFDQFEEIHTLRPMDRKGKEVFFQTLGEALRDDNLWALFALREEYLPPLEPYVDWIPTRWTNTFRLDLLDEGSVLEVLHRTAEQGGRTFDDTAAKRLFADLARTKVQQPDGSFREEIGRFAEPVQLQVVCRRLWDAMPRDDLSIDPEDLSRFGDVSQALGAYYDEAVSGIAGRDQGLERRIRAWFGERLISAGGIRGQVRRGVEESEGLPNAVVEDLLDAHLIRAEKRAGATWYELAHDRLIQPVLERNAAWLDANLQPFQRQAALWVQQGRHPSGGDQVLRGRTLNDALRFQKERPALVNEDEDRLIGISRAARRTRLWTRSLLGLLAAVVVGFAGTAWWLKGQAEENAHRAEDALKQIRDEQGLELRLLTLAENRAFPEPPYTVDILAKRYEGEGPGHVGTDFLGNVYYGTYRIQAGDQMSELMAFLRRYAHPFYNELEAAGGIAAARQQDASFVAQWRALADDPVKGPQFAKLQTDFVMQTDFKRLVSRLASGLPNPAGAQAPPLKLDVTERSIALQATIFSIAVQYGPSDTRLLQDALSELGEPASHTDAEIIAQLYRFRDRVDTYFPDIRSKSANFARMLKIRYHWEENDALQILAHERH